jgi:hypothetical protein
VPVLCFLQILCFRKVTQQIFSKLDEIKAERLDIKRSFQKTEEEEEPSQGVVSPPGGAAQALCGDPVYHCMCSMQVVDITLMNTVSLVLHPSEWYNRNIAGPRHDYRTTIFIIQKIFRTSSTGRGIVLPTTIEKEYTED